MTQTTGPGGDSPVSDYRIDAGAGQNTRPASHHVLGALNFILVLILAAVSFALFWVVAIMLGVV
jgi:hypothetical protein